jgi:hypothetical protein
MGPNPMQLVKVRGVSKRKKPIQTLTIDQVNRLIGKLSREPKEEAARRDAGIRSGIVTAGLILVISLGAKLAVALGAVHYGDIALRATMAIAGAFLAVTGNAIPKTLTPLAALHCDPARVQAVQRLAGWTWALAGLAVVIAWLTLPINLAEAMSFLLLPSAILVTVGQAVWLRRAKPSAL